MVDLLDAGADPDHTTYTFRGCQPPLLHQSSVRVDSRDIFELLLKSGCNPDSLDRFGHTLLCHAVHNDNPDLVELLLESGADPDILTSEDMYGSPSVPLLHRALETSWNIVLLLLRSGCNPNLADSQGYTVLYRHTVNGGTIEEISCLLEYADPNIATTGLCWTPLHWVTYTQEDPALVKLLCERGANPDKEDATGSTPLHIAIRYRRYKNRDMLHTFGADIHTEDFIGLKPDSYYCWRNIDAFNSIVGHDIDIFGRTLLEAPRTGSAGDELVCGGVKCLSGKGECSDQIANGRYI